MYEASAFVRFHPAGREVMMKGAGRDNSEDFDMHSKRAREVWRELRVGELMAGSREAKGEQGRGERWWRQGTVREDEKQVWESDSI